MNQLLLLGLAFFALQGAKRDLPAPDPDRDPIDGSQEPVDTPPPCNITQGYYQPIGGPKLPMDTNKVYTNYEEMLTVRPNTYYVAGFDGKQLVILANRSYEGHIGTDIEPYNPYNYTIESNCA